MKSTEKTIEELVISYLEKYNIPEYASIITACSGGPDSTAMASLLCSLSGYSFQLTAVYYNHHLRAEDELAAEIEIIKKQTSLMGIELVVGGDEAGRIRTSASSKGLSIEEAARNARYEFLHNVRISRGADYIAVGHNLDDNAETMLMRFLQNAGTAGLGGIPEKRGCIIRPLSYVSRSMIEEYIGGKKLICSIDKTNLETDFLRNRLRHDVIPAVKNVFPEYMKNLKALSQKIKADVDFIDLEAGERIIWEACEGGFKTDLLNFNSQPEVLRIRSIFSVINDMGGYGRISYGSVKNAVSISPDNGKILLKTPDAEMYTSKGYIFLKRLEHRLKKSYLLYLEPDENGKKYFISGQKFIIFYNDFPEEQECSLKCISFQVCEGSPLIIRSYRHGDKIRLKTGSKTLKKLFSEWKVNSEDKQRVPIIEDAEGIAAVVGEHLGYMNRKAFAEAENGKRHKKIMLFYGSDMEITCERS